ncbi:MAG: methyltransferase [Paracoccus sp. (in: a-proteobacteria)]|uniref:tRNA1(Val) (adenine(37)-N6)-methyltransferase n=1 Tax=Paracoccus sp. TaxID=267 RepID=UPI0026DEACE0|nr:methyltransferase domain-containing protein [Paracoccus sp. (in: a-proteobacteria)]MDO5622168.1 methyltransferase [Paracoccus sp. (in: a-proteobacteria)]
MSLRRDGFLGGRLALWQPAQGYRAGADAVMLAAAVPARAGDRVLELGCGAGVAALCLAARVPGVAVTGLELQADYAALAMRNAAETGLPVQVIQGDLAAMPASLRDQSFDHVMMNPPYFLGGTEAPDAGRSTARHEAAPLSLWLDAGLRRLRPGGWLVAIHRAERLADLLAGLSGRAGALTVLPIAARQGREAGRVIVAARKGARSPLRLLAPLVVHEKPSHSDDSEDFSPLAQAVLRDGAPIVLSGGENG